MKKLLRLYTRLHIHDPGTMTNKTVDPNPLGGDIISIDFTGVHAGLQSAIPLGAYFINNFFSHLPS